MHFSAALLWSKGAAEFSSSYVMVCWCLCLENLFFSWRVSGAVSYLSWVTAERAAGRGRCARVWGSRKEQLLSLSSLCVQRFLGSPSSSQSTGQLLLGSPGQQMGEMGNLGRELCLERRVPCVPCAPGPREPQRGWGRAECGGNAVGQGMREES